MACVRSTRATSETLLAAIGHRSPSGSALQAAAEVVALETEIARISKDKVARRDPRDNYHKIDRAGVARAMPRLSWDTYWAAVGLPRVQDVAVTSIELLTGLDKLLVSTRPEVWRAYLAFHVTDDAAPLLTQQLEDAQFAFLSALTGQPEQSPRWKRCVAQTVAALGDLVGQAFVRDRFGGGTRLDGAHTVGENIADIGGVKLSLAAYRQLRSAAPDTVIADGFTEDQQFFLGFGQAWCAKMRPDFERMSAAIDAHAPARWRVDGALSVTPEFARAFRCRAGSRMVPAKQCVVW